MLCHAARSQLALLWAFAFQRLQNEMEHELDPLFKQLLHKVMQADLQNEKQMQEIKYEWEQLNAETNERL